jgi:hypothetical protein
VAATSALRNARRISKILCLRKIRARTFGRGYAKFELELCAATLQREGGSLYLAKRQASADVKPRSPLAVMTAPRPYYRMMKTKRPIGFKLEPKGGPHTDPAVEAILARYRKDGQIDRAAGVYFAETPDFSSLGIPYDKGFIHIVEPIGEPQRRDQAWLGEIQLRHHKNAQLISRLSAQTRARRREFDEMSDQVLWENYFAGVLSRNPTIEVVGTGARVVGHHSETPVRVRRRDRDLMPKR